MQNNLVTFPIFIYLDKIFFKKLNKVPGQQGSRIWKSSADNNFLQLTSRFFQQKMASTNFQNNSVKQTMETSTFHEQIFCQQISEILQRLFYSNPICWFFVVLEKWPVFVEILTTQFPRQLNLLKNCRKKIGPNFHRRNMSEKWLALSSDKKSTFRQHLTRPWPRRVKHID